MLALVVDVSRRELDDRARLDVAVRADVMADAGRHRAQRLALVVPVGVDDRDRQLRRASRRRSAAPARSARASAPARDSASGRRRGRCGTRRSARPCRSAGAASARSPVRRCWSADAGGDAGDQPVSTAVLEAAQRLAQTFSRPRRSSLTISRAFDADQRRDVAELAAAAPRLRR